MIDAPPLNVLVPAAYFPVTAIVPLFDATATAEIHPLSYTTLFRSTIVPAPLTVVLLVTSRFPLTWDVPLKATPDRKCARLNSSNLAKLYAVLALSMHTVCAALPFNTTLCVPDAAKLDAGTYPPDCA